MRQVFPHGLTVGLLMVAVGWSWLAAEAQGFPRIAVREGRFVEADSGRTFIPVGVNYYRVGKADGGKDVHATFCPGFYDRAFVEKMMADLQAWGFNTVRTFQVYHVGPSGILTSPQAREISPAYRDNVVHFLQQARQHGVHVIFSWDIWLPPSEWWSSQALPGEAKYDLRPGWDEPAGINNFRFGLGSVRTRVNGIVELIRAIGKQDPDLLRVVMAWELENEAVFAADRAPFNKREGTFRFGGKDYDLAADEQTQALMDEIIVAWASVGAGAIHGADPQALVSASVFTFAAVGRGGPGTLSKDKTGDNRIPARPLALLRSGLDYVDMHSYAWRTDAEGVTSFLDKNLASDEWPTLSAQGRQVGKPILVGEAGVFANYLRKPPDWKIDHALGVACLREHLQGLKAHGLAGVLYWPYGSPDSTPNDETPALALFPQYVPVLQETWRGMR